MKFSCFLFVGNKLDIRDIQLKLKHLVYIDGFIDNQDWISRKFSKHRVSLSERRILRRNSSFIVYSVSHILQLIVIAIRNT